VNLQHYNSITGLLIGQVTDKDHCTGCTVVLAEAGAVAGVDVRGGAPGTHGTDALRPENLVDRVHAVVLTGGSAYGLASVRGVMEYLRERNCGFVTGYGIVPIVVGAVVFDLALNRHRVLPDASMGYRACEQAVDNRVAQGNAGAGTGSTVGKLFGIERAMKGGQGFSSFENSRGLQIWTLAVVNAFGDVRSRANGQLLAGARSPDGQGFADAGKCLRELEVLRGFAAGNTVLGVVATNARFDKAGATRIAQMAQAGISRVVVPAHTLYDGDTVFALCTGEYTGVEVSVVGALAADLMAEAVINGVIHAQSIGGLPAHRDFQVKGV